MQFPEPYLTLSDCTLEIWATVIGVPNARRSTSQGAVPTLAVGSKERKGSMVPECEIEYLVTDHMCIMTEDGQACWRGDSSRSDVASFGYVHTILILL